MFSGASIFNNELTYYNEICKFDLSINSTAIEWKLLNTTNTLFNSKDGGSSVYNDHLYYFFGWYILNNKVINVDSVARLDLKNTTQGWEILNISPNCDPTYYQKNSFGYYSERSNFYMFGGYNEEYATNSVINITLNTNSQILDCSIIFDNNISPTSRHGATMIYISGGFYLFGGKNKDTLLSDLWFFALNTNEWSLIKAYGEYPSPRYMHAASSQGDFMVIIGGIGNNNLFLQDYFLFDNRGSSSEKIEIASDTVQPPPIAGRCAMMNLPKSTMLAD